MKREYKIVVRGNIPHDLKQRVSALHAMAILQSRLHDGTKEDNKAVNSVTAQEKGIGSPKANGCTA